MYISNFVISTWLTFSLVILCWCRLSEQAQKALETVGSSYSKQIAFRDAWAFIGRSPIRGFSPFEEVLIFVDMCVEMDSHHCNFAMCMYCSA